MANVLMCR